MTAAARSTLRSILLSVSVGALAALATLMLLVGMAQAQVPADVPDAGVTTYAPTVEPAGPPDDMALVEAALRGVRASDTTWQVKVGLVLVALMALLRRYATRIPAFSAFGHVVAIGAFFGTGEGGSVLLALLTFGGGVGSALSCGGSFDWRLVETTLKLAVLSAGGWHVIVRPLWERVGAPLWARLTTKPGVAVVPPAPGSSER